MNPTWMLVVAAAIADEDGRMLLQQCPQGKRHAGLWEFPGGKVEAGETPGIALVREIEEELSLKLDPAELRAAGFAEEHGNVGVASIVLLLYTCAIRGRCPRAREGQQWDWFGIAEALELAMPPMDRQLLENLAALGIAKP